ncbi:hypothetical protein VPH35_094799 [Triticum aestivum]
MGRLFLTSLAPATGTIYCCKHCDSHLAYAQHIISKMFRCKHGKAYLFDKVVNVVAGESEDDRMMTTGLHTVRDIFCVACGAILGWKYVCNMNLYPYSSFQCPSLIGFVSTQSGNCSYVLGVCL